MLGRGFNVCVHQAPEVKVKVISALSPLLPLLQTLRARTCRACCPACSLMHRSPPPPAGTWCGIQRLPVWWPVAPAGSRALHSHWQERSGYRCKESFTLFWLHVSTFCIILCIFSSKLICMSHLTFTSTHPGLTLAYKTCSRLA